MASKRKRELRRLIILTGASGSGKTATARLLGRRALWEGNTYHLDDIGVPTGAGWELFESGESWQNWATTRWIDYLATRDANLQLLDAQTRPRFILDAAAAHADLQTTIVLLDCSPDVRRHRLVALRDRAELANPRMENWASYLRDQAKELGIARIDTSLMSVEEVAVQVESLVDSGDSPGDATSLGDFG